MQQLGNNKTALGKARAVVSIAAALLGAAVLCQSDPVYAAHGGGGHGGGFHGGGGHGGFHGGGFHGHVAAYHRGFQGGHVAAVHGGSGRRFPPRFR
jgi:hypothetical protein